MCKVIQSFLHLQKTYTYQECQYGSGFASMWMSVMSSLNYEDVINVYFNISLARNAWSNYVAGSFCPKRYIFCPSYMLYW